MASQLRKQQHWYATAWNDHVDALLDQRAALCIEKGYDFSGEIIALASPQDLSRLEHHGMHTGDSLLQPVFADLVLKPGNVAAVDRDDAAALAESTTVQH